jgi:hypothetical protein
VVKLVNERAHAEAVAEQDKLVLVIRALFARPRKVLDCLRPLRVRRSCLARERMYVVDERGEQLECPRIWAQLRMQLVNVVGDRIVGALL